jgi:hypothetical protein
MARKKLFRGEEEKFRVKCITGGHVVITTDGQIRFDLYPEGKKPRRSRKKGPGQP